MAAVPRGISGRLGRWIRIGRDPAMAPIDARYVVLTNIVALLGIVFTLAFTPVVALSGVLLYPALQLVYALAYLPTLWLNSRGRHVAATTALVLGSHVTVVSQVLVDGVGFDVHLFFMLHAVMPFLLFPPKQERRIFVLAVLACVELVVVVVLRDRLPELGPAIAPERVAIIRPVLDAGLFASIAACAYYARRATLMAEDAAERAHQRSEELLRNILPPTIAGRLKQQGGTIADGFGEVTVLFADLVGFTRMSSRLPPERVVDMLNELFCAFDDLADAHGLEKIKTIGDCYMAAAGLPEPRPDHADAIADMALAMIRVVREFGERNGEPLEVRIGIHSGPVVAGVIGKRKFIYDMWGDTVNTASRMESHGLPGSIQVSETTHRLLADRYQLDRRGTIEVKGKGAMDTWLLAGRNPSRRGAGVEVREPPALGP